MQSRAKQSNAMQCKAMQSKVKQSKVKQCNAMQCKAKQSNATQINAMQFKAKQSKAMQCTRMVFLCCSLGKVVLAVFETRLRFGVLAAASAPKRSALAPKRLASLRSIPLRRKCYFLRVCSVSEGAAGPPLRNGVREHGFASTRSALLIQDIGRKARKKTRSLQKRLISDYYSIRSHFHFDSSPVLFLDRSQNGHPERHEHVAAEKRCSQE